MPLDSVLADALGLTREPEVEEAPEIEYSEADLKRLARRKIVFDERSKGATEDEIYEILRQKAYPACKKTIWNDLHSDQAVAFTEELQRVQFRDIALLRAFALQDRAAPDLKALAAAIQARGLMIKYIMPQPEKSRVKVEVNVKQQQSVKVETKDMLAEYEQVLAEAAGAQTGNIPEDHPGEPVHKTEANSKASEISST